MVILAALFTTSLTCNRLFGWSEPIHEPARWLAIYGSYAALVCLLLNLLKLQGQQQSKVAVRERYLVPLVSALCGLAVQGGLVSYRGAIWNQHLMPFVVFLASTLMLGTRALWRVWTTRLRNPERAIRNTLILGLNPMADRVRDHFISRPCLQYAFKGKLAFADGYDDPGASTEDVLGCAADVLVIAQKFFVDQIVLTRRPTTALLVEVLAAARTAHLEVRLVPELGDLLQDRSEIEYVGNLPTVVLHRPPAPTFALVLKRVLDVIGSLVGLLLTAPLTCALAVMIKLDTEGPLFYASERIGYKGLSFTCYKFRTMVRDAEMRKGDLTHLNERSGVLFKISRDPRVTRMGKILRKYSLDELPQLWNVLRGDMSLVGPRPAVRSEVEQYRIQDLGRLAVTPGITGLWQVKGRTDACFERYVELDQRYISKWSLWLDLKILLRTVAVVIAGTGS